MEPEVTFEGGHGRVRRFGPLAKADFTARFSPLAYFPTEVTPMDIVPITSRSEEAMTIASLRDLTDGRKVTESELDSVSKTMVASRAYSRALNEPGGRERAVTENRRFSIEKRASRSEWRNFAQRRKEGAQPQPQPQPQPQEGAISGDRAVYRTDNGALLGIVGKNYEIVQNRDLWKMVKGACQEAVPLEREMGVVPMHEDISSGGSFTTFTFEFPDVTVEVAGDRLNFNVSVSNSFGGQVPITISAGATLQKERRRPDAELPEVSFQDVDEVERTRLPLPVDAELKVKRHGLRDEYGSVLGFIKNQAGRFRERGHLWNNWVQLKVPRSFAYKTLEDSSVSDRLITRFLPQKAASKKDALPLWELYLSLGKYSSAQGDGYKVRGSGQRDNVAETLYRRRREVSKIISSEFWDKDPD